MLISIFTFARNDQSWITLKTFLRFRFPLNRLMVFAFELLSICLGENFWKISVLHPGPKTKGYRWGKKIAGGPLKIGTKIMKAKRAAFGPCHGVAFQNKVLRIINRSNWQDHIPANQTSSLHKSKLQKQPRSKKKGSVARFWNTGTKFTSVQIKLP